MRVLLVEDDRIIGKAIVQALRDAAHAVDWAQDGDLASRILGDVFEIVLLDLMLPGRDGMEVLGQMRARWNDLPIIVITARDAPEDRVKGLDAGADDYLVKPFDVTELLARIRAVTRRRFGTASPLLSNGTIVLDPVTREAVACGQRATLSKREFALLRALLVRPGAILSRAELEARIYGPGEEIESNMVDFIIHGLRRKLGSTSITNVRGLGWGVQRRP